MSTPLEYRLGGETCALPAQGPPKIGQTSKRNVLIYRNDLVEHSETFVVAQAKALRRFQAVYCGLTRCEAGILPRDIPAAVLVNHSSTCDMLRKRIFMYAGWDGRWQRQCSAFAPVLMHAHFTLDAAFALPLRRALRIPLIVSMHGYDITYSDAAFRTTAGGRLLLRRRERLMAEASVFVCVSEFIRRKAIECGYPKEKLWMNPIGIDLATFSPDSTVCREESVLFVGRLVEKKGCAYLIRAMQSVQRRHPQAGLIVIGDGPLRAQLETLAGTLLPGKFTFMGAQSVQQVLKWLRKATVFSVPSVQAGDGNAEGLGMVFCEAQATGLPVVSFNSGGIAEAVTDGETGYLVPERDEVALADRICEVLENDSLWNAMSRKGRLRMAEKFDLITQTAILETKYEEVLAAAA